MRKQYLSLSLACPRCFIEFPKDRRTQNDAPRHHARRAPKLAVLYRIHEFLQKSTKNVTKKLTKKNEKSICWHPKVFPDNHCKMLPEIKISERTLHTVKMYFWALLSQKKRKTQQKYTNFWFTQKSIYFMWFLKSINVFKKISASFKWFWTPGLGFWNSTRGRWHRKKTRLTPPLNRLS